MNLSDDKKETLWAPLGMTGDNLGTTCAQLWHHFISFVPILTNFEDFFEAETILGGVLFCQSVGHHHHEHKSLEKQVISVWKKGDQG